jgi:hypothetical protein
LLPIRPPVFPGLLARRWKEITRVDLEHSVGRRSCAIDEGRSSGQASQGIGTTRRANATAHIGRIDQRQLRKLDGERGRRHRGACSGRRIGVRGDLSARATARQAESQAEQGVGREMPATEDRATSCHSASFRCRRQRKGQSLVRHAAMRHGHHRTFARESAPETPFAPDRQERLPIHAHAVDSRASARRARSTSITRRTSAARRTPRTTASTT